MRYPSINWWPGNLRPYETRECFVARFCDQNGTTPDQAIKYLNVKVDAYESPAENEIKRVALILREQRSVVATVLHPLLRAPAFAGWNLRRNLHMIRLCPQCSIAGYHSNFHEMIWLDLCPLHGCKLEIFHTNQFSGTHFKKRVQFLQEVMHKRCGNWPVAKDKRSIKITAAARSIVEWLCMASNAITELSRAQIWESAHGGEDILELLGRARRIAPLGRDVEKYFIDRYGLWHVERRDFGPSARDKIEKLPPFLGFSLAYYFYKCLGSNKNSGVMFIDELEKAKSRIERRHGRCRCQWRYFYQGWSGAWRKSERDERNDDNSACPFQCALTDLSDEWGGDSNLMSRHSLMKYELDMTKLSHLMRDADLISYTSDANLSPEGYLYLCKNPLYFCKWNTDSALSDMFSLAANWELDLRSSALDRWLDDIEGGNFPGVMRGPRNSIRLIKTAEGVALMKWIKII